MRQLSTNLVRSSLLTVALVLVVLGQPSEAAQTAPPNNAVVSGTEPSTRLCRYGVDVLGSIEAYPVSDLRIGWFVNFTTSVPVAQPEGITYLPTVRFLPTSTGAGYRLVDTTLEAITAAAIENSGSTWIVGNEPDSPYQDNLTPGVYAQAYHDVYQTIRAADPTAVIANGGIVQVTPVRLLYLDLVLQSYLERYGEPMPVDLWNIHVYILQERSCTVFPEECWGAEIPPGIDWAEGELYTIDDNANLAIFEQMVRDFRSWMASRGHRDRPLIITEFGVQMPAAYGFPSERVNAYMDGAFDFLRTASSAIGYPADKYRLVQRWAWWVLQRPAEYLLSNGWLYDPGTPPQRTVFGDNYAAYATEISPTVNLFPVKLATEPASVYSPTEPVTVTLEALIANEGEIGLTAPFSVRFYMGTSPGGGQFLSSHVVTALGGCGGTVHVSIPLESLSPGSHPVYVVVDPEQTVLESDEADNVLVGTVIVATDRVFLPQVVRHELTSVTD